MGLPGDHRRECISVFALNLSQRVLARVYSAIRRHCEPRRHWKPMVLPGAAPWQMI